MNGKEVKTKFSYLRRMHFQLDCTYLLVRNDGSNNRMQQQQQQDKSRNPKRRFHNFYFAFGSSFKFFGEKFGGHNDVEKEPANITLLQPLMNTTVVAKEASEKRTEFSFCPHGNAEK